MKLKLSWFFKVLKGGLVAIGNWIADRNGISPDYPHDSHHWETKMLLIKKLRNQ